MNDVLMKLGSLLSVMCRHRSSVQLWYCEPPQMNSADSIIDVVLGTEFSYYDRRTGDNKTRLDLKTGAGSSHGKSVQWPIRFAKYSSFRLWLSRSTRDRD